MVTIQEATLDQAPHLLALELAAFDAYRETLVPPSSVFKETPEVIYEKMARGVFLIALVEQQLAGMVFFQCFDTYVYFGRLAVLPAYQGRGIGTALINEVEQRAQARGFTHVRLGVRLALSHLRARYERLGYRFVEAHSHEGYDVPTWVILEKQLEGNAKHR